MISLTYLGYVKIASLPISAYIGFLCCLFGIQSLTSTNLKSHKILIAFLVYIISLVIYQSVLNEKFVYQYFMANIQCLVIIFIILGIGQNTSRRLLKTYLYLVNISLFFGIMQTLGVSIFWDLRQLTGYGGDNMVEYQLVGRLKSPGLSFYSVQLSYQVTASILCLAYLKMINAIENSAFIFNLFFIFVGTAVIGISSSFVAISIFIVLYYSRSLLKPKYYIYFFLALFVIILTFILLPGAQRLLQPDSSMISRIIFVAIGLIVIKNNLLGVPIDDLLAAKTVALQELGQIEIISFADYILKTSFHNTFINITTDTGLFGLVITIMLSVYIYKLTQKISLRHRLLTKQPTKSIFKIFIFAYIFQIITHNASIFYGDLYVFFVIALILKHSQARFKVNVN